MNLSEQVIKSVASIFTVEQLETELNKAVIEMLANPEKIISASTPTDEEEIYWQEYLHSSQSHYFMFCPHCNKEFEFVFSAQTVQW